MAKRPRKLTPKSLENGALHYLGRFSTSSANLKRVLLNRVARAARAHDTDVMEGAALVDDLIRRFEASGLLDDGAYARARAMSLNRIGNSTRTIRAKLRQKGVAPSHIDDAIRALSEESPNPELAAAAALARRRRLGPYRAQGDGRAPDERGGCHEKDLAALARAGFSYDMARRVMSAESVEALEDEIGVGED